LSSRQVEGLGQSEGRLLHSQVAVLVQTMACAQRAERASLESGEGRREERTVRQSFLPTIDCGLAIISFDIAQQNQEKDRIVYYMEIYWSQDPNAIPVSVSLLFVCLLMHNGSWLFLF
jgi:hypothetical protein